MPKKRTGETITKIALSKKGTVYVYFGSKSLALSQDAFTENPLYVGKEVSPLEYRELLHRLKQDKLRKYALSLAGKGAYSAHDIRGKLQAKFPDDDAIPEVMFDLKKNGFLDDAAFAEEYKEEKEREFYGQSRILEDLRFKHGIAEEHLARLSFKDEKRHASQFVATLTRKLASLPIKAQREKALDALMRRGFERAAALSALSGLKEEKKASQSKLRLVAESALKRYGRKYNGYELRAKTFTYLLSKGYATDDIDHVLEELS